MDRFQVIVGNIGTVYSGDDDDAARCQYEYYAEASAAGYGRAGGEDVVLMADDEIEREHHGRLRDVG